MGAHRVSREEAPELYAIVERLCIQANLPMPHLAVADTPMPNAFAVGRSPSNASVCVTTGLLRLLRPTELEAVLAHELTHIQNRDVMVMTIASFFASIAAFIVQMGFWFGGALGGNDRDNNGPSAIVVILVAGVVYVISFVLLQALSRYREFAADRGSAIITGRPSALSSALLKISGQMGQIPQQDLRAASGELAAFYIFPPKVKDSVATLFSTHPSLEQRLAALARLESQLQGTAA
jgi:heat shock protein HtpX